MDVVQNILSTVRELEAGELVGHNRFNRVLWGNDASAILGNLRQTLAGIHSGTKLVWLDGRIPCNLLSKVAEQTGLLEEWTNVARARKLHEQEVDLFVRLLTEKDLRAVVLVDRIEEVFKWPDASQSARFAGALACAGNDTHGRALWILGGSHCRLGDLLYSRKPFGPEFPSHQGIDLNDTKFWSSVCG